MTRGLTVATVHGLIVHFMKDDKSLCNGNPSRNTVFGDPKNWPDNHLFVRLEDKENAREVNCPICRLNSDPNPHLEVRLNVSNLDPIPVPTKDGELRYVQANVPGVSFDVTGFDAFEEKTGQSAHFDRDLGRWHRIG